jgi:DNA-binding GntR family transcriptional regulator
MVKDFVAARLREEIISGRIAPGERIVEGKWASKLGIAQASVREALNILIAEGFVEKGSGQTARVVNLTESDVGQIYEVRAALESLAARLAVEKKADLTDLEQTIADMRAAVECKNVTAFYERDLRFHMLICEKSGNKYLDLDLRRLIVPLFAFVILRIHGAASDPEKWARSIEQHRQILDAIRSGDPFFAEHQVDRAIKRFAVGTKDVLCAENSGAEAMTSLSRDTQVT